MDKAQKKIMREEYDRRRPQMGIICWQCENKKWIAVSKDIAADFNSTSFQLRMGSWPNKEMQSAYKKSPEKFQWLVLKTLDYKDHEKDYSEDLELLYIMCLEEFPEAGQMRTGRK